MASDSRTDRTGLLALLVRGLFCGVVAGAVVGLADAVTSILSNNELVRNGDVVHVTVVYALLFAPCGLLAALIATRFDWSRRATALLCAVGGATFFLGASVNVRFLPSFGSWISIVFDLFLLIAAYLWMRRAYHGPGDDEVRWGRWIAAASVCVFVAGLLHFVESDPDGPKVGARTARDAERPNVLVFMVDTLRADALGCYGYEKKTSPEIDAFAADAVRFEDCRAPSPWTKPSVASLFTSLYPTQHACVQTREILVPEAETLAEVLRSSGWRTAAFTDNPFVSPEFGLGQGFDHVDYVRPSVIANGTLIGKALFMLRLLSLVGEPGGVGHEAGRGAQHLVEQGLLPWLDARDEHPWFAYVHIMEPHLPYDPPRTDAESFGLPRGTPYEAPPPYNGVLPFSVAPEPAPEFVQRLRAQYDGEVRDASRWFGRTIDELKARGLYDNTIVVFVADHGEELRGRGGWTHGHSLHRELLQVPLIMRAPDAQFHSGARGLTVRGGASLLDVFPTLLDLCDVVYPRGRKEGRAGTSLAVCLRDDSTPIGPRGTPTTPPLPDVPGKRVLLAESTSGPVELRSLREGRHLYMRVTQPLEKWEALYDVVRDKDERRDQSEGETLLLLQISARLDALFDALEATALTGRSREIDAETAQRLAEIGYTGGK